MKRIIIIALVFLILLSTFSFSSIAQQERDIRIVSYDDGSYSVYSFEESISLLESLLGSLRSSTTKTATVKHYDSDSTLVWKAAITADFSYNGSTASCTRVSKSTTVYNSSWKCTSSSCSTSGATATGNFTFKKYTLGIPTQTINETISMTCDKNGNIT